jgi:hypothetical protein
MAPASCSLDQDGLDTQLERYRVAGIGAQVIEQRRRRLVIRVSGEARTDVIDALVAVERGCCPFFEVEWDPDERRLAVAVSRPEHEPALGAIAVALGLNSTSLILRQPV